MFKTLSRSLSSLLGQPAKEIEHDPQELLSGLGWSGTIVGVESTDLADQIVNPKAVQYHNVLAHAPVACVTHFVFDSQPLGPGFVTVNKTDDLGKRWDAYVRTRLGMYIFDGILVNNTDPNKEGFDVVRHVAKIAVSKYLLMPNVFAILHLEPKKDDDEQLWAFDASQKLLSTAFRHNSSPKLNQALTRIEAYFQATSCSHFCIDVVAAKPFDLVSTVGDLFEAKIGEYLKSSSWESAVMQELGLVPQIKDNYKEFKSPLSSMPRSNEPASQKQIQGCINEIVDAEKKFLKTLQHAEAYWNKRLLEKHEDVGLKLALAQGFTIPLKELIHVHEKAANHLSRDMTVEQLEPVLSQLLSHLAQAQNTFNVAYTSSVKYVNQLDPKSRLKYDAFVKDSEYLYRTRENGVRTFKEMFSDVAKSPTDLMMRIKTLVSKVGYGPDASTVQRIYEKAVQVIGGIEKVAEEKRATELLIELVQKTRMDTFAKIGAGIRYVDEIKATELIQKKDGRIQKQPRVLMLFNKMLVSLDTGKRQDSLAFALENVVAFKTESGFSVSVKSDKQDLTCDFESEHDVSHFLRSIWCCKLEQDQKDPKSVILCESFNYTDFYFAIHKQDEAKLVKRDCLCIVYKDSENVKQLLKKHQQDYRMVALVKVNDNNEFQFTLRSHGSQSSDVKIEYDQGKIMWFDKNKFKTDFLLNLKSASIYKLKDDTNLSQHDELLLQSFIYHAIGPYLREQDYTKPASVKSFGFLDSMKGVLRRSSSTIKKHNRTATDFPGHSRSATRESTSSSIADVPTPMSSRSRMSLPQRQKSRYSINEMLKRTFTKKREDPLEIVSRLISFIDDHCAHEQQLYLGKANKSAVDAIVKKCQFSIDDAINELTNATTPHLATTTLRNYLFLLSKEEQGLIPKELQYYIYEAAEQDSNDSELVPVLRQLFEKHCPEQQRTLLSKLFTSLRASVSMPDSSVQKLADVWCIILFFPPNSDTGRYSYGPARTAFECFLYHAESILLPQMELDNNLAVIENEIGNLANDFLRATKIVVDEAEFAAADSGPTPYYGSYTPPRAIDTDAFNKTSLHPIEEEEEPVLVDVAPVSVVANVQQVLFPPLPDNTVSPITLQQESVSPAQTTDAEVSLEQTTLKDTTQTESKEDAEKEEGAVEESADDSEYSFSVDAHYPQDLLPQRYKRFRDFHWTKYVNGELVDAGRFKSVLEPIEEEPDLQELLLHRCSTSEEEISKLQQDIDEAKNKLGPMSLHDSTLTMNELSITGASIDDFVADLNQSLDNCVTRSDLEEIQNKNPDLIVKARELSQKIKQLTEVKESLQSLIN
ncbi:hypothetical protein EDD86DRAFT_197949 [Gorgonomyces haynaldii]|nr:hypothetical protein EDD86DRAFT_197949 [Gorgonomyces haynaldii]